LDVTRFDGDLEIAGFLVVGQAAQPSKLER